MAEVNSKYKPEINKIKLTDKQEFFCQEYMIDLCGTQAAIRAGYSPKTAGVIACELLKKPKIDARIAQLQAERSRRTGINADRVIREFAKIAFLNAEDVVDMDSATVKEDADKDDTAAIQSVKVRTVPTENGEIIEREVRFVDKNRALEQLGRHLGIFNDKLSISGDVIDVKIGDDDE